MEKFSFENWSVCSNLIIKSLKWMPFQMACFQLFSIAKDWVCHQTMVGDHTSSLGSHKVSTKILQPVQHIGVIYLWTLWKWCREECAPPAQQSLKGLLRGESILCTLGWSWHKIALLVVCPHSSQCYFEMSFEESAWKFERNKLFYFNTIFLKTIEIMLHLHKT